MDTPSSRARVIQRIPLVLLAVWLVGLAVWTAGFPWVWDDRALVDPEGLPGTAESLRIAWTEDFWHLAVDDAVKDSGMYRPVVHSTYIAERILGGGPGLGHVVNVGLHGLVALLAGLLALQLGGPLWLAAGLVLVHPYAAEAIANVTARTDPLAAAFLLGALLAVVPRWTASFGGVGLGRGALSATLVLFACLSKEVAFVAPALFAAVAWAARVPIRDLARAAAPAITGAAAAFVLRSLALDGGAPTAISPAPMASLASMGWVFLDVLAPVQGHVGPWPPPRPHLPGLVGLGVTLALLGAWLKGGGRAPAAALVWVLAAWLPMADWAGVGVRSSRALVYVPMVGFAVLLAASVGRLRGEVRTRLSVGLALLIPIFAALQTRVVALWSSDLSLWERALTANPDAALPRINYARAQAEAGNREVARAVYEDAARIATEQREHGLFEIAATSVAMLALTDGDLDTARAWYERALAVVGPAGSPSAVRGLQAVRLLEERAKAPYTPAAPATPLPDEQ